MVKNAVVIGVNKYQDEKHIRPLDGAENDARELGANLEKYGQFTIVHSLLGERASCENIRQAMSDLFWKTDNCDLALFYFSGHGFQDGYGEGYIAPQDIKYNEPFVRGIRIQELKNLFLACKGASTALLILDSCHSGIATQGHKAVPQVKGPFYEPLQLSADETQSGTGRFVLASSRGDQESREDKFLHEIRDENDTEHVHGIFTFHLLEGLNGHAVGPDNRVTLATLHDYMRKTMQGAKEQERTFWGFGAGGVEETVLVEPRLALINTLFDKVNECLAMDQVNALFHAIKYLDQAARQFPGSTRVAPLKDAINKRLTDYKSAINSWRWKNMERRMELSNIPEFLRLEDLTQQLCFDKVSLENPNRRYLLVEFVQVSRGELDVSVLISDLSAAVSSASPPSPAGSKL